MKLSCPSCGAPIKAEDMNLDRMVAKCRACHAVFDFQATAATRTRRDAVPLPSAIQLDARGGELVLTRAWRSPKFYFMAFFCVIWDGFLFFWYAMTLGTDAPLLFALVPVLHVGAGVWLTYFTLCGFVNRTRIVARSDVLTVRHQPLPWPGARTLPTAELSQLFTVEREHRGKNGTSHTYEVTARVSRGADVKLIAGLPDQEQALFIEQQLEAFLGIHDEPVVGEVPR